MVRVAVVLLLLSLLPSAVHAKGRVALLIGNQEYSVEVGPLKNPHNDIKMVGKALEAVGFTITEIKDATRRQVLSAVKRFASQVAAQGPDAVGFFYFSGHGVSRPDDRANYLIPVDLKETHSSDFWFDAVKLDDILMELERAAPSAAHFVVFDACRDELKLPEKSAMKGFEPVSERSGMFIAFATALGAKASDRGEASGPYAAALATELLKPGQDHLQLFQNVKEGVFTSTERRQVPWERNGLVRRVYFASRTPLLRPDPDASTQSSEAERTWYLVKDTTYQSILQAFAKQFGETVYAAMARVRLEELQKLDVVSTSTPAPPPGISSNPTHKVIQPLGRLLKLTTKIGALPNQKGWLGVRMQALDLPLAISLGLANADGALVVEATQDGPAGQSGVRFGDIVVGFNGKTIATMDELGQSVASTAPESEAVLDIWRVSVDEKDFISTLRALGESGNPQIMLRLAKFYANGQGVPRDDVEAVRWYRKAADVGDSNAMTALAVAHLDGRGLSKDPQEALRLLKVAAQKDNLEAIYRLAVLTNKGDVTTKDPNEAARLFTRAAEAGHTGSMVDLGLMYYKGEGVPLDYVKAANWYKRAADLGNASALVNLGFLHQLGKGVEKNDVAAANLYKRAADQGNPAAIHNLAAMFDSGKGVEQRDPEKAADLVLRALDLRNEFSYKQMTQNSRSWSKEFRQTLQKRLRDAGLYTGSISGEFDESTIAAINGYINRKR